MEQALSDKSRLSRRPLVAIVGAFAIGVSAAALTLSSPQWLAVMLTIAGCALVLAVVSRYIDHVRVVALMLFAALGFLRYSQSSQISPADPSHLAGHSVVLSGVIESEIEDSISAPQARSRSLQMTVMADGISESEIGHSQPTLLAAEGRVRVSLSIDPDKPTRYPWYGDRILVSGRLDVPAPQRNPGGYDESSALFRRGIHSRLTCQIPTQWRIVPVNPSRSQGIVPFAIAAAVRSGIERHNRLSLPSKNAAVLNAILLGAREELTAEQRSGFSATGLSHLLSTAGLHVAALVVLMLWLLTSVGVGGKPAILISLVCLSLYTIATGERAASVRAAIMIAVYLVGQLLDREPDRANAISLAGLVILIASPQSLFDPGFQISFVTIITMSLGIRLFLKPVRVVKAAGKGDKGYIRLGRSVVQYFVGCVAVTLLAELGSLPIAIYYFHMMSPIGPCANLIVAPVIAPLIGLGLLAPALGSISPVLSAPIDAALRLLTDYILHTVNLFSQPPFGAVSMGEWSPLVIALYYGVLWYALIRVSKPRDGGAERDEPQDGGE